jgi:putative NIF3 family GTP cyclohydrolase 1 type 2
MHTPFLSRTAGLLLTALLSAQVLPAQSTHPTAGEVIERVKKNLTCPWSPETVDTFKSGNPERPVTGIVTTFTASMDVLRAAVAAGANLIISHEPTYYNHLDRLDEIGDDPVLKAKADYIREHGLIVFRFHDHWHRTRPDGILEGMISQLEWKPFLVSGEKNVFRFKQQSLRDFCAALSRKYPDAVLRIVGDPSMTFTGVGLSPGASGYQGHVQLLQRSDVEVLVVGEAREWETVEYARDAVQQGKNKALVLLSHVPSEEGGMEYLAQWLKGIVPEVPVRFIPAGNAFWTVK